MYPQVYIHVQRQAEAPQPYGLPCYRLAQDATFGRRQASLEGML